MPTLNAKLAPLKASLTAALIHSLSALDNRKTIVVKLISFLLRLGAGPAARSTLLAARSEVSKKRVRMIRFEGAVEQYINDLAVVVFTGIKHTADWFLASFKENDMASGMFTTYDSRGYLDLTRHGYSLHRLGKIPDPGFCHHVQETGLHFRR